MAPKLPVIISRGLMLIMALAAVCLVISAVTTTQRKDKLGDVVLQSANVVKRATTGKTMGSPEFWRNVNLQAEEIPAAVSEAAKKVVVNTHSINIMGADTFYRSAEPPAGVQSSGEVVVLLHGAAFKSKTWLDLGTIHNLTAMGHGVFAIDLPGYGESRSSKISGSNEDYLAQLVEKLGVIHPILLSPSMSGGFSIPFLLKFPDALSGYVPVAPVGSNSVVSKASQLALPTHVIQNVKNRGLYSDHFFKIAMSHAVELPNAGHPAYLDQPKMFHTLLYNFIKQVHAHRASN
ncbi:unnamed protein product, partial [Meganyctiphanes norvegica]